MNHSKLLKSALACAVTVGMAAGASVAMAQGPMHMTPEMMKMAQQRTMMTMKKDHYVAYSGDVGPAFRSMSGQQSDACRSSVPMMSVQRADAG